MRIGIITLELILVFVAIPSVGVAVWTARANKLVQRADVVMSTDPKRAARLYKKAEELHLEKSPVIANRLALCKTYGIGVDIDKANTNIINVFETDYSYAEISPAMVERFKNDDPSAKYVYSYIWPEAMYDNRTNILAYAIKDQALLQSLSLMPQLDLEEEHKLWNDSRGIIELRAKLVGRLTRLAEKGIVWAQKELASCYQDGVGVVQDDTKSFEWSLKAAKQGDMEAATYVALCYKNGLGVETNCATAVEWLLLASKHDGRTANMFLGDWYLRGIGVEMDVDKAIACFKKCVRYSTTKAYSVLEFAFKNRPLNSSIRISEAVAKEGAACFAQLKGMQYYEGAGVKQDFAKAAELFERITLDDIEHEQLMTSKFKMPSSMFGYVRAKMYLAKLYEYGLGVTKDENKAFSLYRLLADLELSGAQCKVGDCYLFGRGVKTDAHEAFKWYMKAAKQNDPTGQAAVAYCYIYGIGVCKDIDKGYQWAYEATDSHSVLGSYLCGVYYEQKAKCETRYLDIIENLKAKAVRWYMVVAMEDNYIEHKRIAEFEGRRRYFE